MVSRSKGRPLRAFRVADGRYPLFDGGGAAQYGARWNSPGHRVIYAALTYAGALLERLAQAGTGKLPTTQRWIAIDIPASVEIEEVESSDIPGWNAQDSSGSRAYGDRWLAERRSVALVVPSVVGWPHERNLVLNQDHPDFSALIATAPEPVRWDRRLLR